MEKYGRVCKEVMLKKLGNNFKQHPDFIAANFINLTTQDVARLKGELRRSSSIYTAVKDTIARLALKNLNMADAASLIEGPLGIVFIGKDPLEASRVVVGFSKEHENFKIRGGFIGGKLCGADVIKEFSTLPPKNVLLARAIGGIKSPITGLVIVLGGTLRNFVYVINQIKVSRTGQVPCK